jgi:AcrR family transcriptional regulator
MARLIKDAEERRLELLETAGRLFYEIGYDQTSVQAITDSVGVAKGTFYHYFDSKEDLLRQLTDAAADDIFAALQQRMETVHESALEELRSMLSFILAFKTENRRLMMAYAKVFYRNENILLRHSLERSYIERLVPFFAHVVEQGTREGVFDVEDPTETAEVILFLMYGGLGERIGPMLTAVDEHPEYLDVILKKVLAVEIAMGRILGIKEGTFKVYDVEAVKRFFTS